MSSWTQSCTANPSQSKTQAAHSESPNGIDLSLIVACVFAAGALLCILSITRSLQLPGLNALSNYKTISSISTAGLLVVSGGLIRKSIKNRIPASKSNSGAENASRIQQPSSQVPITSLKKPFIQDLNDLILEFRRLDANNMKTEEIRQKIVICLQTFYFLKWLPVLLGQEGRDTIKWEDLITLFGAQSSQNLQSLFTRFRFPKSSWDSTPHINAFLVSLFNYYCPGTKVGFRPGPKILMMDGDLWWKEVEWKKSQWNLEDLALYLAVESDSLKNSFTGLGFLPDENGFYSRDRIEDLLNNNPVTNSMKKIETATPRWSLPRTGTGRTDAECKELRMPSPK